MGKPIPTYSSNPRDLSDEELRALAAEIEEAYYSSDSDGLGYWQDDEAGDRCNELAAESHRRFMLANPDWKPPEPGFLLRMALDHFNSNLRFGRAMDGFDEMPREKIGDTIIVRQPIRFHRDAFALIWPAVGQDSAKS